MNGPILSKAIFLTHGSAFFDNIKAVMIAASKYLINNQLFSSFRSYSRASAKNIRHDQLLYFNLCCFR